MSNPYRPALTDFQKECIKDGRAATLHMLTRGEFTAGQDGLDVTCGGDKAVEWDEHGALGAVAASARFARTHTCAELDRYAVRYARSGTLNTAAWRRVADAGGGLHWTGASTFHVFVPHARYARPLRMGVDARCAGTVVALLAVAVALLAL